MDGAEPVVSVVVATHNRADRLAGLLASLARQTLDPADFEVIVVDDGSHDHTQGVLDAAASDVPYRLDATRFDTARGPAAARNAGWRRARAGLVAFTDDDCEATESWLAELVSADPRGASIVQGPTSPIPAERNRLGPFSKTRDIEDPGPWFATCNILYPRGALESLGGFDEGFPEALGEDTDLGWRARAAGIGALFAPDARVHHAVDELGLHGHLRTALLGSDAVLAFGRHPALRREGLRFGLLRTPAHVLLILAAAGIVLGRRHRAALALTLPYARYLASRCRADGAGPQFAAYYAVYDVLHLYATVRGDIRHRVLVI